VIDDPPAPSRARPDRFDVAVVIAAIGALLVLVRLGMGLTFFSDEWAIIADRSLTAGDLLRPFNEHWLAVTMIVYRAVLSVFGMGTYVPYLALLAVLHITVALLVYALVRRRTLPLVAVACAGRSLALLVDENVFAVGRTAGNPLVFGDQDSRRRNGRHFKPRGSESTIIN
jgi:hypothetical protein